MDRFVMLLENLNVFSTIIRLALALLLGGVIGMERGRKRRPAGLRTYMIVCMASALVMITGEYILLKHGIGDPSRLGAQVVSGIGFLGAGTIIVTSRQVRGLTTAAGLWAAACMGLAVGAGFYAGAIVCGFFLLLIMAAMTKIETYLRNNSKQLNFFAEFKSMESLGNFMNMMRAQGYKLLDIEIKRAKDSVSDLVGVTFWVETEVGGSHVEIIESLGRFKGVKYLEELEAL